MYTVLKRQCSHLSPILSGDGASTAFSSSDSSPEKICIPPPPSVVNLDSDEDMKWRKSKQSNKPDIAQDSKPWKFRKIISDRTHQYNCIGKKKIVRFREEKENGTTNALDNTESSLWSGASYGFSKYMHPKSMPAPPPPSPQRPLNFPRTNPHLPKSKLNLWSLSGESSCSTTTTTASTTTGSSESNADAALIRYDTRFSDCKSIFSSSMANSQRRRILAGLKSFGIKGELLISILLNRGLITITIDEARNLISPCVSGCCSTYVRLALMPDEEKRSQCKTELIPFTTRPIFHQTFTVELLPEDYEKRLVISMWHRERANEKSMLMGCMAFTIRHMMESNKVIDGWYFLLSPEYGRKKHLAVHKVNMLTYYGSIDSDIEKSGTRV